MGTLTYKRGSAATDGNGPYNQVAALAAGEPARDPQRCGALQSKIDGLKSKLQDTASRRGSAPGAPLSQAPPSAAPAPQAAPTPGKKDGLFGRLFGGK